MALSATIPPAKLPVIEGAIARGEIGTSLGALRVLDSRLDFLSGRASIDGAIGQIVTRVVVHECTLTSGPAFPEGRVWHVGADPYNLTPLVRAQREIWLARCPMPCPVAVKAKPAKQSAPKPHRWSDKTTQLNDCMWVNEWMARYSPLAPAVDPLRLQVMRHMAGYLASCRFHKLLPKLRPMPEASNAQLRNDIARLGCFWPKSGPRAGRPR